MGGLDTHGSYVKGDAMVLSRHVFDKGIHSLCVARSEEESDDEGRDAEERRRGAAVNEEWPLRI